MANGEGHRILTRAAIESLPEWERELLAPVKEALEREYCMYGDDYFGHKAELGPYVELPDGRLPMDPWEIRHFRKDGPGDDYYICGYYDLMRTTFAHFAAKCVECLRKGNFTGFAKFAGTAAHVIEDCGCPPHAVGTTMGTDMKMIKLLSPGSRRQEDGPPVPFRLRGTIRAVQHRPRTAVDGTLARGDLLQPLRAFHRHDRALNQQDIADARRIPQGRRADNESAVDGKRRILIRSPCRFPAFSSLCGARQKRS